MRPALCVCLTALILAGVAQGHAQAYVRSTSPAGNPVRRVDFSSVPFFVNDATAAGMTNADGQTIITGDSDPIGALQSALATWSSVPSSAVRFQPLAVTSKRNSTSDNQNVFVFQDTPELRSIVGSAVAVTVQAISQDNTLVDTDILFSPNITIQGQRYLFSTTLAPGTIDLQSVATHELGHVLGADHTPLRGATMYLSTLPQTAFRSTLSADDVAFLTAVYPAVGAAGASGAIQGRVSFQGGGPVRGASVVAVNTDTGDTIGALSDGNTGSYSMSGLPPGEYVVYAEPLSGPVTPDSLGLDPSMVDTSFQTNFFGGLSAPQSIAVSGGSIQQADIIVSSGSAPMTIQQAGTGAAEGSGDLSGAWSGANVVTAGVPVDLLLFGPGLDSSITDVRVLGKGVSLRQGSVRIDSNLSLNGIQPLRLTLDIAADAGRTATVVVVKGSAAVAYTTGIVVGPPVPVFSANSIVNGASFQGSGVVPGEIASLFGTGVGPAIAMPNAGLEPLTGRLATTLGSVTVTFDGVTAPLFYVSGGQINLQVPYEVAGRSSTSIVVRFEDTSSASVTVPVVATVPGIFAIAGSTQGIVQNGDYTLNSPSNPAVRGGAVIVYATGGGPVDSPPATGEVAVKSPLSGINGVTASIGGLDAPVVFAGMTPGFVGLMQANIVVPQSVPPGNAVPIQILVNGVASQANVTIAVR